MFELWDASGGKEGERVKVIRPFSSKANLSGPYGP